MELFIGGKQMTDTPTQSRSRLGQLLGVTLGIAVTTIETVDAGLAAAGAAGRQSYTTLAQITAPLRAPLDKLGVTAALANQVDAFSAQAGAAVTELEARGKNAGVQSIAFSDRFAAELVDAVVRYLRQDSELLPRILAQLDWILPVLGEAPAVKQLVRSQIAAILPELAADPAIGDLVRAQLGIILPTLGDDEQIQRLIRTQVAEYLVYLNEHPEQVQALIRSQGNAYIDYLNAHPVAVQTLLQGQSLSLAAQVRDEVRERTVTADDVVDMLVRKLLRLKPREELPPPPANVRGRAETGHLSSDEQNEHNNGNR
jgi:hypothetical protein